MIAVLLVKDPDGNCLFLAETEGKIIIFVMVQHVCVVYTICVCVTLCKHNKSKTFMVGELFIWYGYPPYRVEPAEFKVSFEFNRGQSTKTLRSHNLEKLEKR